MNKSEFSAPHIVTELPSPKSKALIERDEAHTSTSLIRPYPLAVKRARGAVVEDLDGNRFLDFAAGIAVCTTGHCHPRVVDAIQRQAEKLIHISCDFYYEPYVELAEKLTSLAPDNEPWRVFFANSGAEAVEGAVKLARYYTGRPRIIAFQGAFHGRTMGAVTLTASKVTQKRGFAPMLPGVEHIPYGYCYRCAYNLTYPECDVHCVDVLEEQHFRRFVPPDEVAAIIVEPIQGEGGYVVPPPDWLPRLRELCDRHGILLIADEVQSGMGRTGRLFASEHWGVVPDIITRSSDLASGMPISAFLAKEEMMDWETGAHSTTFGGNPVSCAAALETIELLEDCLMANAAERGAWMMEQLEKLALDSPIIGDVRGLGLMIGVEFVRDKHTREPAPDLRDKVLDRLYRHGLLTLGCGESGIRFSPPLTVSQAEVEIAMDLFAEAVAEVLVPAGA
ncbi:MAG: Isoleucine 2-epimerase [Anaerolineales bacterium]|nr:Isoleucine 2-epimerase [Anaerolineales bacterium]